MIQDNVITVSYRWTVDELVAAHLMHQKVYLRSKATNYLHHPMLLNIFIGFVGLVALTHMIIIVQKKEYSNDVLIYICLLFVSVYVLSQRLFVKRYFTRQFEKQPSRNKMVHYIIDDQSIKSKTEDLSESNSQWSVFAKVARTPLGFLLYPNERLFHWIPNHAFSSVEEANALEEIARRHVAKFVLLK